MTTEKYIVQPITLRHAHARMLNRYMPWIDYMLTITFGKDNLAVLPRYDQALAQVRHLTTSLNSTVWGNRGRFNYKCQILSVSVVEGATTITRTHAHILLGNVKSAAIVEQYLHRYIPRSQWLAPRHDLREVYDVDGVAWYLAKEAHNINTDAIAWEIASIPRPLLP